MFLCLEIFRNLSYPLGLTADFKMPFSLPSYKCIVMSQSVSATTLPTYASLSFTLLSNAIITPTQGWYDILFRDLYILCLKCLLLFSLPKLWGIHLDLN